MFRLTGEDGHDLSCPYELRRSGACAGTGLRDDDAGFFVLEFLGAGKLAAEEFDELAGARSAVGAKEAHAIEEDEELENLGVLGRGDGGGGGLLLHFVEERGERIVELALNGNYGRLFVDNAGGERFVGFGQGEERLKNIRIGGGGLGSGKFGDGEGHSGQELAVELDGVAGDADIEERSIGRKRARVLLFVAVRGEQVAAVGGAVDGDFALRAATDGADFFRLGRTEAAGFAFVADWTKHERSPGDE